jgi:hypothetical protein
MKKYIMYQVQEYDSAFFTKTLLTKLYVIIGILLINRKRVYDRFI